MSTVGSPETKPAELFEQRWQDLIDLAELPSMNEAETAFLANKSISPLTRFLFLIAFRSEAEEIMERLELETQAYVIEEIDQFAEPFDDFSHRNWMYSLLLSLMRE